MKQLDLLTWTPPRVVIVFPLAKRIGRVRRVAEVLEDKRGNAAVTYWKQTLATLSGQMERAGVEPVIIDRELRSFHAEVERELRSRGGRGQRPGGSAA